MALVGSAVLFSLLLFLLRGLGFKGAPIVAASALVLLMMRAVELYKDAFDTILPLIEGTGAADAVASMVKVTGLTYLYGISSDVCREIGEAGIAKTLELVGRVEIIMIAAPYFRDIIKLGAELI